MKAWHFVVGLIAVTAVTFILLLQVLVAVNAQTRAINRQGCFDQLVNELILASPTGPQTPASEVVIIARLRQLDRNDTACAGR